jgi:hypothetical protein
LWQKSRGEQTLVIKQILSLTSSSRSGCKYASNAYCALK